jgi:hypothetical protein
MELHALMTVGFLGLASGGFGGEAPIPIGTGIGAQTYGNINSVMVQLLASRTPSARRNWNLHPDPQPSDFIFGIIVADDGKVPAGGWQAAKANLPFKNSASRP